MDNGWRHVDKCRKFYYISTTFVMSWGAFGGVGGGVGGVGGLGGWVGGVGVVVVGVRNNVLVICILMNSFFQYALALLLEL